MTLFFDILKHFPHVVFNEINEESYVLNTMASDLLNGLC